MNKRQRNPAITVLTTLAVGTLVAALSASAFAQSATKATKDEANEPSATVGSVKPVKRDKEVVYKQVMPDGRVVYGDEPMRGHPVAKVIEVDLRSTATWAAKMDLSKDSPSIATPVAATTVASEADQKAADSQAANSKAQTSATARLLVAEERFNRANEALKNAEAPLAGERSMNANGTSRLNLTYFERQEKTKAQAQQAALEYDSALTAARNAR